MRELKGYQGFAQSLIGRARSVRHAPFQGSFCARMPSDDATPSSGPSSAGAALAERRASSASPPSARAWVVALTGASSFLGTNLVGLLEEDDRVHRIVS